MSFFHKRAAANTSNGSSGSSTASVSGSSSRCKFHTVSVWETILFMIAFVIIFFELDG